MEWLWILAIGLMVIGLAGIVLPVLPGTPLLFGGMLLGAWIDHFEKVGVIAVVVLGVLAALAWAIDFVAGILGTKLVGASGYAMAGAGIGGVIGLFGGIPGLIFGPVIGAAAGELYARRNAGQAARAGVAAGLGFVLAMAAKLGISVAMLAVFVFAYFV
ncbi:DUF456 domain-containing protein [Niveibacterium umoris]|uniref:DUF456 domain-containing protein n=1 Tax=Niveibacterium umoris TaxID=1193620 RepID=A0A840BBE3_9RHOO|nr:DUF456 domain-containing protein [Niveibacterium umoris]MBB4010861.1 hypothetical protein [Niveibacterium umoris]